MFASAEMSWYVEGVIITCVNVSNQIRWTDKQSMANKANKEQLRRYIINSEEIIFAEQFKQEDLTVFEHIRAHLDDARIKAKISRGKTNKICDSICMDRHYFALGQFTLLVSWLSRNISTKS